MNKEFLIGSVFEKIDTQKIKGKANDFPTQKMGDYTLPLLTAGIENQGLARYAKRSDCPTILSNCISVSANGANSGVVFYHPEEFAVLQDAYAIQVKNYDIPTEEIGLYLAGSLHKAVASTHDWNYKAGWNRIKDDIVTLPIKTDENGNPIIDNTHFYHKQGYIPDFDYMQERIAELEQERIAELEQYLAATGLNDYELTDEDIKTLSLFDSGCQEKSDSENIAGIPRHEEFLLNCIAALNYGNKFDKNKMNYQKPSVNFVSRTAFNNGISDFVDEICRVKPFKAGALTLAFGGSVGSTFLQESDFYTGQNVGVIEFNDNVSHDAKLYIASCIERVCKQRFIAFSNEINKHFKTDLTIELPIQTDADNNPIIDSSHTYHKDGYIPDWDFMEKYIRTIEKIVIKDVVTFKDETIAKTKSLIA